MATQEKNTDGRSRMDIVIVGHVDHGKSTVIGRLLADTGSLPEGKLEAIREYCARNARPFEYAFLLDALKDEQAQGITIDTARTFFKSEKRDYVIIDAPGHIEFLKNMVTGAARAEAAVLVIDAKEGIQENSKRHGYLLSMLGIKQIVVAVNKMDLVDFGRQAFEDIRDEYVAFLARIGVTPRFFVPLAAFPGENMVKPSEKMPWYKGPDLLSAVDALEKAPSKDAQPFRLPVQDVYKFTASGDDRRITAGRVESGTLRAGDEVIFLPSGKRSTVKTIEGFNAPARASAEAGTSTGVTFNTQLYVGRGEIMSRLDQPQPQVSDRIRVNVFWMGRAPLRKGKDYLLKLGTAKVPARLEHINVLIDASESGRDNQSDLIERHDVADCILQLKKPIAFDPTSSLEATGRFVLVDAFEIAGGGIIREALESHDGDRNAAGQFHRSFHLGREAAARAEALGRKGAVVVLAGDSPALDGAARTLESQLLDGERPVPAIVLGAPKSAEDSGAALLQQQLGYKEVLQRLGEAAFHLAGAGNVVILRLEELDAQDAAFLSSILSPTPVLWIRPGNAEEAAGNIEGAVLAVDAKTDAQDLTAKILPDLAKLTGLTL
jgi:bifunctional enzyme CysN/CysC